MKNNQRVFVEILTRYCADKGIEQDALSHDWIFVLKRPAGNKIIVGYDLGLNSSTVHTTAKDKAATYDVLNSLGVPALEHRMFLTPRFLRHIDRQGNWQAIIDCHADNRSVSVVKANEGTGGTDVYLVRTADELELAVHEILARERGVAVSPFKAVSRELRAYVLGGDVVLLYEKERPSVMGDGRASVAALCRQQGYWDGRVPIFPERTKADRDAKLAEIPPAGHVVPISWKHNLGQGAKSRPLAPADEPSAVGLAQDASRALGLVFGAVDIVDVESGLEVLEVNSGVMFESAHRGAQIPFDKIYDIYARALDLLLAD